MDMNRKTWMAAIAAFVTFAFIAAPQAFAGNSGHHSSHRSNHRWSVGIGFGPGFGYGGYGYSGYRDGWGSDPWRSGRYGRGYYQPDYGAIDCDVDPEEAEVYIDGRRLGTADNFDGYPDFLYLRPGRYQVDFYMNGYRTETQEVRVRLGEKITVEGRLDKLGAGESAVRPEPPAGGSDGEADDSGGDDEMNGDRDNDRDRWRRQSSRDDDEADSDDDEGDDSDRAASDEGDDDEDRTGTLEIELEPEDAAIYIDGEFVGNGRTLDGKLKLDAGTHTVVAVHPGYAERREKIRVLAGRTVTLDLELESSK